MCPFEVVEPGQFLCKAGLEEGECALGKNGTLTMRKEDLDLVGIEHFAIVLADPENFRIGLRAVRDGEEQSSVAVSVITRKNKADSLRRKITVARAIKRLSLTPEACAARYTLNTHKDSLLFITVTEAKEIPMPPQSD